MNKNFKLKKSSKLVSAALAGGLAVTGVAGAEENVFAASELPAGYMVAAGHGDGEGKCGEGKCGEGESAEGKCGEGNCGEGERSEQSGGFWNSFMSFFGMGKDSEGKCGEGTCGGEGHDH